jgi:SAM-dependent methyltransferase
MQISLWRLEVYTNFSAGVLEAQPGLRVAFMLDEYVQAGARFAHPILDPGCGDGIFGAALRQRGVLDPVDVCLDTSKKELRRLAGAPAFGAVCGDLTQLPLAGASIGSAFSGTCQKCPLHLYTSECIIWPGKPYSLSWWAVP